MEINDQLPAAENPEQTSSEEQGTTSPARSYDCTFCKRGFSNAQALGGHMNIHRRDKAKLKQASSSDNIIIVPKINMIPSSYSAAVVADSPGKWPWFIQDKDNDDDDDAGQRDKTHVGEIRKLPLFDEKPSKTDQSYSSSADHHQELEGCSAGSDDHQLDLELRLGPERSQDSSPTMTTKKFF